MIYKTLKIEHHDFH